MKLPAASCRVFGRRRIKKSLLKECSNPERRKIAVKVVDIFGNDTMKIIQVTIGGKRQ
jgi:hypothetical protein